MNGKTEFWNGRNEIGVTFWQSILERGIGRETEGLGIEEIERLREGGKIGNAVTRLM